MWTPAEPLPSGIDGQKLAALRERFDAALMPADQRAFAVQIDRLFRKARLWRIDLPQQQRDEKGRPVGPDPIAEMVEGYRADLGHLPADLLEQAITWACQHWRNSFRLPMAGDLLDVVAGDLSRRKRERMKLGVAALKIQHAPRDRSSAADQRVAAEAFAEIRKNITANPSLRVMGRRQEDGREPSDTQEAVKRGREMLSGLSLDERVARARG